MLRVEEGRCGQASEIACEDNSTPERSRANSPARCNRAITI